jgi:hypothetical protein
VQLQISLSAGNKHTHSAAAWPFLLATGGGRCQCSSISFPCHLQYIHRGHGCRWSPNEYSRSAQPRGCVRHLTQPHSATMDAHSSQPCRSTSRLSSHW